MEQDQNLSLFGLSIDNISKNHLSEAAKWAKFLAICGFIMIGLMMIYGLAMSILFTQISNLEDSDFDTSGMKGFLGVFMFVFYSVFAVLAFFPYLFLFRFATKMKRALESDDQNELNNSFMNLKILYRYMGILTIIGLAFMVLMIFSMILTAVAFK